MISSESQEPVADLIQPSASVSAGSSDEQLNEFYARNAEYLSKFEDRHLLTDVFLARYHESLFYYKNFYDDLDQIGNPETCTEAFYFIPGFNGTPGQMRFGLPSLIKQFGSNIFMKSLYLEEFSSRRPTWMKYSEQNLQMRRLKITQDLEEMSAKFPRVRIITSSTGFYDFLAVYSQVKKFTCKHILYWISCAPDQVSRPLSEKIFYAVNGFTYEGRKWYAYPNQQLLRFINPECSTRKRWRHKHQRKVFFKNDLESRYFCFGLLWDYTSWDCITEMLKSNLDVYHSCGQPIELEAHVMAATKDGFWDDSRPEVIEKTLDRYLVNKRIIYRETSHLWVVTPEKISDLIG
jgi:hypothetical protein